MVGLFLQSGYALLPSQPHHRVSSRLTRNLILFVAQHSVVTRLCQLCEEAFAVVWIAPDTSKLIFITDDTGKVSEKAVQELSG